MKTKLTFCANCQEKKDHVVTVDNNGEFLFTCECGRFFKLPGTLDKEGVKAALDLHEESNKGQLSQEAIDAENAEKLKNI